MRFAAAAAPHAPPSPQALSAPLAAGFTWPWPCTQLQHLLVQGGCRMAARGHQRRSALHTQPRMLSAGLRPAGAGCSGCASTCQGGRSMQRSSCWRLAPACGWPRRSEPSQAVWRCSSWVSPPSGAAAGAAVGSTPRVARASCSAGAPPLPLAPPRSNDSTLSSCSRGCQGALLWAVGGAGHGRHGRRMQQALLAASRRRASRAAGNRACRQPVASCLRQKLLAGHLGHGVDLAVGLWVGG